MMTKEHIKEALSLHYIEVIASANGYKTTSSHPDYGTDLDVIEIDSRMEQERHRYCQTGRELKLQLKATQTIIDAGNDIKYDLKVKNFNDLVSRRESRHPLILILFILPPESSEWIHLSDEALILRKCAYWYYPDETETSTSNVSTKRITISKQNLITEETLPKLFEIYA